MEGVVSETFTVRIRVRTKPLRLVEECEVPVCFYWLLTFGCGEDWGRV